VKEIAGELEVGSVLEGSVRKAGDSVRIAVQLIDPQSNEHLWAESYDRELIDVLAIQADISRTVAETLKVKLLSKEDVAIGRKQTVDPEGYTLYLKGRYYWNERTKESVNKAMKYFEWAIQVDLAFASAYSGLADCYSMLGSSLWMAPAKAYPQAWEFGKKALEIDDNLAEAHASRGYVLMVYFWDFDTAEREFKRAMELSPNYATAYLWHSYMMFFLQDYEKAYLQGKRALELDPLSRGTNMYLATYLASLGKTDEAMEKYEKTIQMNPDFAAVHYWKSLVHSWLSEHDAAIEEARRAFDLDNSPLVEQWLASAYARAGKKDEAQGILDRLRTKETGEYVSPVWNGMLEISLGRPDEGYRLLERSLADRNQALLFFRGMPWFKEYRLDPRWNKIEERLNLPKRASPL
jgi:serine/threonine-protein kinase